VHKIPRVCNEAHKEETERVELHQERHTTYSTTTSVFMHICLYCMYVYIHVHVATRTCTSAQDTTRLQRGTGEETRRVFSRASSYMYIYYIYTIYTYIPTSICSICTYTYIQYIHIYPTTREEITRVVMHHAMHTTYSTKTPWFMYICIEYMW